MTSLRRPATALAALLTAGLTASVLAAPGSAVADRPDAARGQQVGQAAAQANAKATEKHVIAISVDGLNPRALKKLGTTGTPNLRRLILDEGAGTLNARSQLEMTVTLPNHTSMVTGRRIKAAKGGHGVTWNTDTVTKTVQQAAGHEVDSVFTQVHAAGGTTAVYSTKEKFWLFENSWPAAVDKNVIRVEDDKAIVTALRDDLASQPANFSFVHLGRPDQMGHKFGWMSKRYLKGVAKIDRLVGSIMATVESTPSLKNSTTIVLTSDHGGIPGTRNHVAKKNRENYRVVFAFWGSDVPNKSLYALNPDRANPKKGRPGFGADVQPIRNGEIANASLDLLGIMPVPDSLWDYKQDLNWK